ncbi:IS5 family transposase IS4811 [Paraconexibacter sp. AEG42_29]|uniref:IS5 family transposase IS4811 n=1 Tax=Paraconexibacter sp. AEG42_29 TaxID=2997339 RepID=A0AAU7AWA2_9ACTN
MDTPDRFAPPDPLAEALHALRMDGAFYCRSEVTAPWGLTMPAMPGYLWFHVVTAGHGYLATPGDKPRPLRAGALTLVPHGGGHAVVSEPGAAAPDVLDLDRELVSDRYEVLRHGGGGFPTSMICGAVRFTHPTARSLVALLPAVLQVQADDTLQTDRMHATLRLIAAEARETQPGAEAVITRLADILVIQAVRDWIRTSPGAQTGWLGALKDPQIGHAIALLHREPGRAWTVGELARELAMSRSAFAARFTAVVGEPVMQYATRQRMHVALDALQEEGATVAQLADRLGYASEAAFARAFKRTLGVAPGAARRGAPIAA